MKLVYCTNIWNHHQGPVATELAKLLGPGEFRLMLHQPLDHHYSLDRIRMGWNLVPPDAPWILGPPATCAQVDYSQYSKLAKEAEALVYTGMEPFISQELLVVRAKKGKINIRMGERRFKVPLPLWKRLSVREWRCRLLNHIWLESANVNILTMGHGCVEDMHYYMACKGRIWRWGYLTKTSETCHIKQTKEKVSIGWCGRLIDWKRVDLLIDAVALLPFDIRSKCKVTIVGEGDQEFILKKRVERLEMTGLIEFRQSLPAEEIADFMRELDIYVFPSNRKEGWGAALLEAMDKGCAVIANEAAGSTLEVVQHEVNGLVFKDDDVERLSQCLSRLILDEDERRKFGLEAWRTIQNWSPSSGARRLVKLIDALRSGDLYGVPTEGLCANVG